MPSAATAPPLRNAFATPYSVPGTVAASAATDGSSGIQNPQKVDYHYSTVEAAAACNADFLAQQAAAGNAAATAAAAVAAEQAAREAEQAEHQAAAWQAANAQQFGSEAPLTLSSPEAAMGLSGGPLQGYNKNNNVPGSLSGAGEAGGMAGGAAAASGDQGGIGGRGGMGAADRGGAAATTEEGVSAFAQRRALMKEAAERRAAGVYWGAVQCKVSDYDVAEPLPGVTVHWRTRGWRMWRRICPMCP